VLKLSKLIVEPSLIVEPGTTTKLRLVVVTPRVIIIIYKSVRRNYSGLAVSELRATVR